MANGQDRFDVMDGTKKSDLLRRSVQALTDGQALLKHWHGTVKDCADCKTLVDETGPYLNGLTALLRELGG